MDFLTVYSYIIPIITLLALLYAGIEDLLFREVRREIIWILMICIGIIMDILYLIFYSKTSDDLYFKLAEMLISIVLGFIICVVLFYFGVWGGADSKALWSIAIISPVYPFPENILNLPINSNK